MSRVLSGRTDVPISPEARAKVLEAAEKLGYRPNVAARALMSGRTGLVGFWMSLQYSRYRCQVLDRMRTVLGNTELALAITDVDEEYHWDHSFSRALRVPVDGIIGFDTSASIHAFAREHDTLAPNTPFVSMGAYWSERLSYVGVNLRAGAEEAMDHLLSTGRKRISFMAPITSGLLTEGPRFEAYRDKMVAAGLYVSTIGTDGVAMASVYNVLNDQLRAPNPPEAVLCMNDDLAVASAFALAKMGLKAGHDLALVGFDGIEETEHGPCPVSTVRQPMDDMCELTFEFLKKQMEDPSGPLKQKILKPKLVIRESSGV